MAGADAVAGIDRAGGDTTGHRDGQPRFAHGFDLPVSLVNAAGCRCADGDCRQGRAGGECGRKGCQTGKSGSEREEGQSVHVGTLFKFI